MRTSVQNIKPAALKFFLTCLDGNLAGAETIIGGLVSKLMVCSALRRCFIFSHNLRAPSRQCKIPTPLRPPLTHTCSITVSPLSIPFYLCFSCAHIPVINVKPLLTLWSYAWGRIESWPQPFSKGAPNPAFLTWLPSVSGIRETLSPVIYHNDETQLWATDSCSPRDGNSRGDWDIFRSAKGGEKITV